MNDLFSKLFVFVPPEKTEEFKKKYIENQIEGDASAPSTSDYDEPSEAHQQQNLEE